MNTECVVPDWIHDTFLGYGDPASAHYSRLTNQIADLDFVDTFLSLQHVKDSFPKFKVQVLNISSYYSKCIVLSRCLASHAVC